MNVKKKRTAIAVCIITGTCILAGSAFANYSTANGYDVYKKALKNMIGMDNYTMDVSMSISADDTEVTSASMREQYAKDETVSLNRKEKNNDFQGSVREDNIIVNGDNLYMMYCNSSRGEKDKENGKWFAQKNYGWDGMLNIEDDSERDTVAKVVRFGELLTDAVVGDLKNNFVYVSGTENGGAKYSVSLDAIQIPELINAGISALCSLNAAEGGNSEYVRDLSYTDADWYLYNESSLKSVQCDFEVDSEGRLVNNDITVVMLSTGANNESHTLTVKAGLNMSDLGTTVPEGLPEGTKVEQRRDYYEDYEDTETNVSEEPVG